MPPKKSDAWCLFLIDGSSVVILMWLILVRKFMTCILTVHFVAFLLKIIKFFTSQYLELGKRLGNNAKPVMVGVTRMHQKKFCIELAHVQLAAAIWPVGWKKPSGYARIRDFF